MARHSSRILLVTGAPGSGKTTLVRKVAAQLGDLRLAGFTTEEMREEGRRVGFRIVPFGGRERVLAHVDLSGPARVGRYGVDVAAIDAVAAESLAPDRAVELYVVDEIGKMECFSQRFVAAMRALLDSDRRVLATIARKGAGFIAEVKRRGDAELLEVTARSRELLPEEIVAWARAARVRPG
jgi:nucleoside-triphosphatase